MFRSHAYLLQIGAKNVRRRSHQDQVYQFARASFASDKHAKVNKRSSDGRDVRKREERGSNLVSNKVEGQSLKKLGNPQAVKDILRDILVRVVDLKQTIGGLNDLPPVWAQEQDYQDSRRNDAFHSLKAIISDFEHQVRLGVIKANGKHRHECSVLLEEILRLLSLCGAHSDELSPFDECRRLLDLMEKEWKIELQHNHCEYAVVTASREQRWSEAADVFWRHIDPNRAGYNPCDISITEPIGLYAIARDAQQKKRSAVERVFDAVLRMSMVSPSDQDRYVIAAGTAMGLVGEWQGVVDFLNKASNAGKFGQPLVAAGMKACILCEQYDHAVRLYNELLDANHVANEWQWSGGEDRLHPLCRDLALIALGRTSQTGTSERALAILNAVLEDGAKISSKALFGTLLACEKDGNWRDAIRIALLPFHFHYRSLLASDDEHLLSTFGETGPPSETLDGSLHMLLLPVIRTCTSQGFPGAAVLSQILFATCYEQYVKFESSFGNQHRGCIDSLLRLLSVPCSSKEELLTAIMVSLCGIDSFAEACMIFEETNSGLVAAEVQEVYDWARSQNNKVVSDEWQILFERVQRVAALSLGASRGQVILSAEDLRLISDATATCMRCSVIMSEPGVGLVLSQWLESVLPGSSDHSLPFTDSYLAASIAIAHATGNDRLSHQLIASKLRASLTKDETSWILSCNHALRFFFVQGKIREALDLFQSLPRTCLNPEIFEIVATGLANNKEWSGVTELYGQALSTGCNSEHLSVIAMKAVADGPDSGNVRLLRNIVDEIASLMRKKPSEWLQSKYWILKENLGFPLLRRLMRWNDIKTSHLKELALSIAMFESRVSEGLVAEPTTLCSIVYGALDASPDEMMKIPGVPQDAKQWNDLILRVSHEAERTDVCSDSAFVSDLSLAFWKLGNQEKFSDCIKFTRSKGIPIRPDVLELVQSTNEILRGE